MPSRKLQSAHLLLASSALVLLAGLASSLFALPAGLPWLRLVIGLAVYLLPGSLLFALFPARDDWDLIDLLGYGFAYSTAFITILGLLTRSFAWHIDVVEFIWYALAIAGMAALLAKLFLQPSAAPLRLPRWQGATVALLLIVLLQAGLYVHGSMFKVDAPGDQDRHQAVVNGFLRDEPLGWQEPYYETGATIADRMYLTYWVLAQALVVKISGLPIFLARYLINSFALSLAVASMYIFARNLGQKRTAALFIVILGLLAYSLVAQASHQAGWVFLSQSFLMDKQLATFLLAPVAISSAYLCVTSRKGSSYLAFACSFFATVCVHPLLGALAFVIIALWAGIQFLAEPSTRKHCVAVAAIASLVLAPAILIRLSTLETSIYSFDTSSVRVDGAKIRVFEANNPLDGDNPFYTIRPRIAGDLTYILLLVLPFAILMRWRDPRSKLMLAFAIAVAIALLPYTAWIYGRLLSVNHIIRILWLMPYGYMLGFAAASAWHFLSQRLPTSSALRSEWMLVAVALVALPLTARSSHLLDFRRDIADTPRTGHELYAIASYLNNHHQERFWVAASRETRSTVIIIDWKAIGLSRFTAERMSYYSRMPLEQAQRQLSDNLKLFRPETPVEEKLAIVERYGIDYLLFPPGYAWVVDGLYQLDKQRFELVFSGEFLRMVKVHAPAG